MSCMKLRCIRNNNTLSNYLISVQYPSLHNAHSLILFSGCDCHVPFKSLEVIRNVEFNYVRGSSCHRCWYQQQRKMSIFWHELHASCKSTSSYCQMLFWWIPNKIFLVIQEIYLPQVLTSQSQSLSHSLARKSAYSADKGWIYIPFILLR